MEVKYILTEVVVTILGHNVLPLAVRPQPENRRNVKDTDFVRMLDNEAAPPSQIKRVEVSTETLPKKTGGACGDLFCPAGG